MPLKILVIGASRGTGALAVEEALARGHLVTGFARSSKPAESKNPSRRWVSGDFHDPGSARAAVDGQDAVIITASPSSLRTFRTIPDYFSRGTQITIDAMKAAGARRLVILSALGVGESAKLMPRPARLALPLLPLGRPFADHEVQERIVRESELDWVIARPSFLTNGRPRHRYRRETEIVHVPPRISRADVAHFLVDACEREDWVHSAVQLGG